MRRGRVCQARRGGGVAAQPARPRAVQRALGTRRRLGRARRRKQQRRRGRGRPREAHAAAHIIRIVPVDVPSKADQPRELRLVAVLSGLEHGLAHRVAHRVRRALQAFARSDTCAFGGATRGSAVTLGRRRRALRRGARAARPHAPLGARVAAAAVARGRVADARSDHGAQSRLPQRLAPEAPSGVVWACEAAGEAGHRARRGHWVMRARTEGLPNSRPPLALTFRKLRPSVKSSLHRL